MIEPEDYKGVLLNETNLYEMADFARVKAHLMEIVFALRMVDDYTKAAASCDILDVITKDLDMEFQTGSDDLCRMLAKENEALNRHIQDLEGKVRSVPVVGTVK